MQPSSAVPEPGLEGDSAAPSLTLDASTATALKGDHQCKPGDRYNLTVAVRSVGEDGSLTLDVPQDAEFTPVSTAEEPEGADEVDRFAGPTVLKGVGKSLEY